MAQPPPVPAPRKRPPPPPRAAPVKHPSDPAGVRLKVGERIPGTRYRILAWLGEGATGVVYRCEHTDIGRHAALKILRAEFSPTSRQASLFRDEARAAARTRLGTTTPRSTSSLQIGSPYIVDVYDFGELPDGRLWFAMELLVGESLAAVLKGEIGGDKMDPARAIGILRQVCKGLAAAHKANVIHRDIKPPNIMLVKRAGRSDCVRLVDFGVAAMFADEASAPDLVVGTPHYMAPEQTSGDTFDHRLDVYALGCTAYRMLTGRPPFTGSMFELMRMHREEAAVSMDSLPGCEQIPPALDAAIRKALAKDPADRYDDMQDFEAALCEAQIEAGIHTAWDDLAIPQVEDARRQRLLRLMPDPTVAPLKSARWVWAVAVVALVAMGGVVAILAAQPQAPVRQPAVYEQLVTEARAAASRAWWVYPPADDPQAETAFRRILALEEHTDVTARRAADELRHEFADALARLGDQYWERDGGKGFAADYYAQALVLRPDHPTARERAPLSPGELATLRKQAAELDFSDAHLSATAPLAALAEPDEQARSRKVRAVIEDPNRKAAASTDARLRALIREGDVTVSRRPKPKPKPPAAKAPVESEPAGRAGKAKTLARQGTAALRGARRQEAEKLFNAALSIDGRNAEALIGLSEINYQRGKYARAVRFARRAVAASPNNAGYRIKLGDAHYKNFAFADARKHYQSAADLGHGQAEDRLARVKVKLGD